MNTTSRAGWLAVLILGIAVRLSAQSGVSEELVRADKQFDLYAYNLALRTYQDILKKDPGSARARARVAECFFQLNRPEESLEHFEKALEVQDVDPEVRLHYGLALMQSGDYPEAKKQFRFYAESNARVGNHYLKMCDYAMKSATQEAAYVARNEPLNTEAADFSPAFYGVRLVYNSARTDIARKSQSKSVSDWTGSAYNQLFVTQRNPESGFLQKPALLQSDLQGALNTGPAAFARNGQMVAYCKNNFINGTRQIAEKGITMSLYFSTIDENGAWGAEKPFFFNGSDYATGFPALSADGKTLIFASTQEGGYGGWDLYVSNYTTAGWSTPRNLGAPINTPGNEITPFLDGQNLYFSSDWHDGFGGMDVFKADFDGTEVQNIYQLGLGINSPRDDYGFIFDAKQNIGYLTSNRLGGRGNEDIWQIRKQRPDTNDNSTVFTPTDKNSKPAQYNTSNVTTPNRDNKGYLHLLVTDQAGNPIPNVAVDLVDCGCATGRTDGAGKYYFEALNQRIDCSVNLSCDGYQDASVELYAFGKQNVLVSMNRDQRHEYTGLVLDAATNAPLYSVVVQYQDPASDRFVQTSTDENGRYSVVISENTNYQFVFVKEAYKDGVLNLKPQKTGNKYRLPDVLLKADLRIKNQELSASNQIPIVYSTETSPKSIRKSDFTPDEYASTQPLLGYSVQLEASPDPIPNSQLKRHESLSKYGNIYVKTENAVHKVRLGIYPGREEALKNMREVNRKSEYGDAFVVEEHGVDNSLVVGPPAKSVIETTPVVYNTKSSAKGLISKGSSTVPAILYAVQLASFDSEKPLAVKEYTSVAPMGNVYTKTENGMNKVRLGVWSNHDDAQNALERAVKLGFKDAIVITEKGSDASLYNFILTEPASNSSKTPATYSTQSSNVATGPYFVKIAVLSIPERFDETPLNDLGKIEKRKGDKGLTTILLGGFPSIESATKAQNRVIGRGYEDTYVVKDVKGKLVRQ